MPVHFKVAGHEANTIGRRSTLKDAASSLRDDLSGIYALSNGFVDTVVSAYNRHHNLVIRPDDVWMSILSQFNIYVNAHAEELRSHFVQHEGKKELIVYAEGTRYTVDFGSLAKQLTGLMDEHLIDKELKSWILPNFSTTTHNDTVMCAVYMMATLKAYFSYGTIMTACGIPSVTLEGNKEDWEIILSRIDKLAEFGAEPEAWARLLRPILTRFVQAFDGYTDIHFWQRVCHYESQGSGSTYLCGWVTAFCVWNQQGKWQGPSLTAPQPTVNSDEQVTRLVMDGVRYGNIESDSVPDGFCEVDVKLNDNGEIFDCMMVSGHVAMSVDGEARDTVRPSPAWFMFIGKQDKELGMKQLEMDWSFMQ